MVASTMSVPETTPNVVAVGASAGGVEALANLAAGLPPDLPFTVLVVLHMPSGAPSVLARILDRNGPLPAAHAVNGEPLEPGTIRVAVPNRHLLVDDHRIALSEGPTENGQRPAINTLFRSVALAYGQRAVSVLLSGVLDDGTLGSAAVRSRGGTTIAQSPADALFPAMPRNAIDAGVIDYEITAAKVGGLLTELAAREFAERELEPDARMELENRIAMAGRFAAEFDAEELGLPSGSNHRHHVGHTSTPAPLLSARDTEIEGALGVAMRSLQEKAKLSRRLADQVAPGMMGARYRAIADEAVHAMDVLGDRMSEGYIGHRKPDG